MNCGIITEVYKPFLSMNKSCINHIYMVYDNLQTVPNKVIRGVEHNNNNVS